MRLGYSLKDAQQIIRQHTQKRPGSSMGSFGASPGFADIKPLSVETRQNELRLLEREMGKTLNVLPSSVSRYQQIAKKYIELLSGSTEWILGPVSHFDGGGLTSRNLSGPAGSFGPRQFAKGGYVNRPTLGWIGEGGESEYIIPSSRMAQSAMAYLNGARGAAVLKAPGFATGGYVGGPDRSGNPLQALMDRVGTIDSLTVNEPPQINDGPIQVTTGPVLDFDGQRYVTMDDYQRGLRDVKRQTLGEIRTAAGRRATGR
jgi:hypothetical protein